MLDWRGASGSEGRRLQEEYLEWRVVHDADGGIRRVELTCEVPETWITLAAHAPDAALKLAANFAGEAAVPAEAIFGDVDPFGTDVGPSEREAAFIATMVDNPGPYNNGERAICCMVHPSNTLGAAAGMLAAATFAFVPNDGSARRLHAREVCPVLDGAAQEGRGSDPLVVERLGRLASEGRVVTVEHPVAMAIVGIEHMRLRRPDGHPAPPGCWRLDRPAGDGRFRRVTLEVPAADGLRVGDLVDVATAEPIRAGGQVADLVQVALGLRVSAEGALAVKPRVIAVATESDTASRDADVGEAWLQFTREAAA